MTKIFCDNCSKELPENYHAFIFGFDACKDLKCHELLTLRAEKENYNKPYSSLIPKNSEDDWM